MMTLRTMILWMLSVATATAADDVARERLQSAVTAVCERDSIKGASVSVRWADDHWQGTAGYSHEDVPIASRMLFGIGSNTKTLTSVLLLRLQEEGVLDLDATIGTWFPGHANIDPAITIRQLLQHTSGLGDYSATTIYRQRVASNTLKIFTEAEILSMIPEPAFKAGTSWEYCNTNYYLAGAIATKVTGKTLGELYRTYIYEPVGLQQTFLAVEDELVGDVAHRWIGDTDGFYSSMNAAFSGAWAAGAVFSTASDMTQFYARLFGGGLLRATSMLQMLDFAGPQLYGLGISQKLLGGTTVIGHSGEIRGYTSIIVRVPSLQVSIAVLTNTAQARAVAIADTIVRILRASATSVDDRAIRIDAYPIPARDHIVIQGYSGPIHITDLRGTCAVASWIEAGDVLRLPSLPAGMFVLHAPPTTMLLPVVP